MEPELAMMRMLLVKIIKVTMHGLLELRLASKESAIAIAKPRSGKWGARSVLARQLSRSEEGTTNS
jgi:hypothetical protein